MSLAANPPADACSDATIPAGCGSASLPAVDVSVFASVVAVVASEASADRASLVASAVVESAVA
ncbi:MAG: hypothetical protein ACTHM6_19175, partial [Tepidisphaeraceae bacterium]